MTSVPEIDVHEAGASLDRFRVLDVREPFEHAGPLGALEGAENVPLAEVAEHPLDPSLSYLVVCRSGKRSEKACRILQERGVSKVTNLEGGLIAWHRADLPVVRRPIESLPDLLESLTAWLSQIGGTTRDQARGRLRDWARRADDASLPDLDGRSVARLLDRVEEALREEGAPPDLDLTIAAYRHDLAAL
ncbi:MAG TPA: rhodanese-like domain-containing protein [Myxococcota bacterium]|nr:rhodanese-like domain-containing protein [Myxococcota bacterium]